MKHIVRTGPWLIALAPAWFVGEVLNTTYHMQIYFAVLVAAGVELTGIATYHTFTRLYSYNRRKRQSDPPAPLWIAVIAVLGYIGAGAVLTAVIKQDATLALFFGLAAVGYTSIALNIDQDQRENQAAQDKAKRSKAQSKRPSERPPNKEKPFERSPEFDELLAHVAEHSGESAFGQTDVQQWTERKRTTAYQVLNYGQQVGVIEQVGRGRYVYKNGQTQAS